MLLASRWWVGGRETEKGSQAMEVVKIFILMALMRERAARALSEQEWVRGHGVEAGSPHPSEFAEQPPCPLPQGARGEGAITHAMPAARPAPEIPREGSLRQRQRGAVAQHRFGFR